MNKIFYKQNIIKGYPEKWVPTGKAVLTNLKTADGICQCKHKASNAEEIEGNNFIEYNKFGVFNGSHLIENAYRLFWCSPVKETTGYFPKLKYGIELFGRCDKLEKINAPYFPLLEDGSNTFWFTALTSFKCDFPKLDRGYQMFYSCSHLTEVYIKCPNLGNADNMFNGCKLSADSVIYFADNVGVCKDTTPLVIGTNLIPGDTTSDDYIKAEEAKTKLTNKGWNFSLQYNGGVSSKSVNLIYAKTEPSENGLYITSSGERVSFYWGHEISNPSDATWKIFSSVEEAKEAFGITEVED